MKIDILNYSKWTNIPEYILKNLYEDFIKIGFNEEQIDKIFYIIALENYNIGENT